MVALAGGLVRTKGTTMAQNVKTGCMGGACEHNVVDGKAWEGEGRAAAGKGKAVDGVGKAGAGDGKAVAVDPFV